MKRVPKYQAPAIRAARMGYETSASRRADKRFYASKDWLDTRASVLASEPLCRDCRDRGRITAAVDVHHELERKERPDLAHHRANLTPLCKPCHNARR